MKNDIYTINNLQNFIISWFLFDWYAKDYNFLDPIIFWEHKELFIYLSKNWNAINPDLLNIIDFNWIKKLETYYSSEFITSRDKFIIELYDFFIKNKVISSTDIYSEIENAKKIKNKLEEIRTWNINASNSIKTLLLDIEWYIEENKNRCWIAWFKTSIPTLDKFTEWLQPWTVMRLNAYSNIWKSKFSYQVCNNLLKQWKSVIYFSLEVNKKIVWLNLLANWYQEDFNNIRYWRKMIDFSDYYENKLEIVDNIYHINDIINYTEVKKPDVIFIDFIQNIKSEWWSEYEKLSNIAIEIQQLAIRNNIAVFDLSQIANEWINYKRWWIIPSKWSWSLVASADVWLMLYKKDWRLYLNIAKNKFWQNDIEIWLEANFSKWIFKDLWEIDTLFNV